MDNVAASADDTIFCEKAYYETLIMDVVAQSATPLPEHMVRMHVYRSINEAYERALAQLVTKGKLSYSDGLYHLVHGKEGAPQAVAPVEAGRMALRADTTIDSLKSCAYGSLFPVVAAISFDSKPDDGLTLMGYHAPTAAVEEMFPEKMTVEQGLGDADDIEPVEVGEMAPASEEPNSESAVDIAATTDLNSEPVEDTPAPKAADPEPVASVKEPEAAGLESAGSKPAEDVEQANDTQPAAVAVLEPSAVAARRLVRPQYLSGWDDPRCVFDSATQVAFLDKKGVADVFGLIRELGKVSDSPVRTAFEQKLRSCALPLSPQYRAQATGLSKLSGNKNYVFDIYGNLRMIGPDCPIFENVKGPMSETLSTVYAKTGEPLSLWNLSISSALQRKLKWDLKIRNLPELLAYTPSRLRVRGLTSSDVHSIIEALDAWPSGRLSLEKTADELKLARYAAMGGWYPHNDTSLKRVEMVNGLAGEAITGLQKEKLSVSEPSFRLLFCTKLAGKLRTTVDKAAAVNMSLSGFKNEYPAVKAARETFVRLDFALSTSDLNSDALDVDSAEASSPTDGSNTEVAKCVGESSGTSVCAAAPDTVFDQEPKADTDQNTVAFNKWLETLSYTDKLLMEYMLLEGNPQKWQANVGETAEYIRQRYDALMDERPRFDVDAYASLFKAYKLTPEEFYVLSGSTSPAFPYMKRVYK